MYDNYIRYTWADIKESTQHWTNAGLMLAQRRIRLADIDPTLNGSCLLGFDLENELDFRLLRWSRE